MGTTHFRNNVHIKGDLQVDGDLKFQDTSLELPKDVEIEGDLVVNGTTTLKDNVTAEKDLSVEGDAEVSGNLSILGDTTLKALDLINLTRGNKKLDIDYGTATLTNDNETSVTTDLSEVLVVVASEATEASTTPASKILAWVGTGENKNKIYLKAKGATGSTIVNWIAIGIYTAT